MIVVLENPVRSYDWGSITALPELLGIRPTGQPQAELWVGAHTGAPSRLADGGPTLDVHLASDPDTLLGSTVTERFGPRLPYLLKILAVERPLSIQVHPTEAQAAIGFAADDAARVPVSAPNRRYRDRSHKPEMVVAVTSFEALLGFADPATSAATLTEFEVPALNPVVDALQAGSLRDAVGTVLALPDDAAAALADEVRSAAVAIGDRDEGPVDLVAKLAVDHPADRGILLALLMNHVHLAPGDAVFVPSGVPHAYLHGVAVEPQASSDNTLRAGLTSKHVDVDEVAKILRYEPGGALPVLPHSNGAAEAELVYPVPADEFVLTRWRLSTDSEPVRMGTGRAAAWVLLVLSGTARVEADSDSVTLGPGQAAFVPAGDAASGPTLHGSGTVYGVTTAPLPR